MIRLCIASVLVLLLACDSLVNEVYRIEKPWDSRPVTEEELQVARPHLVLPGPGSESTMSELSSDWEPDTLRSAARILGIDAENRLWVKSGFGCAS